MEANNYVSVGNMVMATDTYNNWILFGIIFVIVLVFIILLIMFIIQMDAPQSKIYQMSKYTPESIIESLNTTLGATDNGWYRSPDDGLNYSNATSCNAAPNSHWDDSKAVCLCNEPWWGTSCNRVSYDNRYISTGIYDSISIPVLIPPAIPDPGPFNSLKDCTDACWNNNDCSGVIWDNNICTEFNELYVAPNRVIPYEIGVDSTIYTQNRYIENLIHTDRVFLYSGTLPIRHWERTLYTSPESNQETLFSGIVYNLSFFPTAGINGGNLTGVYSLNSFTPTDYDALLAGGDTDTVYIHHMGDPLEIPPLWSRSNIWVEYR